MTFQFFTPDYEVPRQGGSYMRFENGKNKFRVISAPLSGVVGWIDAVSDEGKKIRKPVRATDFKELSKLGVSFKEKAKAFWMLPVWNHKTSSVCLLEITQVGIMDSMLSTAYDEDWGHPSTYDFVVTKSGEGKDNTKYSTMPSPATELAPEIKAEIARYEFTLENIFSEGDLMKEKSDDQPAVDASFGEVDSRYEGNGEVATPNML